MVMFKMCLLRGEFVVDMSMVPGSECGCRVDSSWDMQEKEWSGCDDPSEVIFTPVF